MTDFPLRTQIFWKPAGVSHPILSLKSTRGIAAEGKGPSTGGTCPHGPYPAGGGPGGNRSPGMADPENKRVKDPHGLQKPN